MAQATAEFDFTPTQPGMLQPEFATLLPGWRLVAPLRVIAAKP